MAPAEATGEGFQVVAVDEDHVVLRRGNTKAPPALVTLVDGTIIPVAVLREALMVLAESVLAADGRFSAARRCFGPNRRASAQDASARAPRRSPGAERRAVRHPGGRLRAV
jgi:hypothetical protein